MTIYEVIAWNPANGFRDSRKEFMSRGAAEAYARQFSYGYKVTIVEHHGRSRW